MKSSHDTYNAATRLLITGRKKKSFENINSSLQHVEVALTGLAVFITISVL